MKKKQELETLAAVNIALLLLFFYSGKKCFAGASLITTLVCLLFPLLLQLLNRGWSSLFQLIGLVNAKILLAIVYFLLLVPVALLSRLFKQQKTQPSTNNYKSRDYLFSAKDFERPG